MTRTDYESVEHALDDVLKAGGILEGRRCAIGVANLGPLALTNPKWHVESGELYASAPYTIEQRQTGLTLFHKKSISASGTKGLLSYDIADTNHKVVILWEVPLNDVTKDTKYNVKVYNRAVPTDKDLFKHIYKYGGTLKSTGWLEREEYGITVLATINANTFAKLYVSVDTSAYENGAGSSELHTACDRHPVKKYCWQECHPTGYCWSDRKCNGDADCQGPLQCYGACKRT